MRDEALRMALEALEEATTYTSSPSWSPSMTEDCNKAITAIKQALAAPVQKRPPNCGTGYCSCVECVMEPAVPDAFGTREGEHPEYIQGWNDCRAEMLKGRHEPV